MKQKARCPKPFFAFVRNLKDAIISRRTESSVQFKEVRKVRRCSADDHAVADCSNLVLYSAFYWQPVYIHKKGNVRAWDRCRQDEQHSSSYAEFCLTVLRDTS